jgi:putative flippase GtrA
VKPTAKLVGPNGLGRASLSSLAATATDFLVFSLLVFVSVPAAVATLLGCVVGAATNFTLNRTWAFDSQRPLGPSVVRYAIVSGASALANSALVALLTSVITLSATPSWGIARVVVFLCLTYPLFRSWVFAARRPPLDAETPGSPRSERDPG